MSIKYQIQEGPKKSTYTKYMNSITNAISNPITGKYTKLATKCEICVKRDVPKNTS